MEERKVTVEGHPQRAVSVSCNCHAEPIGAAGTQYLPEAQVDRFMVSLSIGYPDFESELAMAMGLREESRLEDPSGNGPGSVVAGAKNLSATFI